LLELQQEDASTQKGLVEERAKTTWFERVTDTLGIAFTHVEDDVVDFKLQPIIPHMASRNGPGIAVADCNNDGLDDFYVGGAAGQAGQFFFQNKEGKYRNAPALFDTPAEDMGSLFFDANNDGHPDLYVVSGGVVLGEKTTYQDRLYLNDGEGNFSKSDAMPNINSSGSTVNAIDYDRDGDLDLFVGGRVTPGKYPMPTKSYLLENLSNEKSHRFQFKDVSTEIKDWDKLTMVSSALWTDYDNDGWMDLIVVGEFMAIEFFHNQKGRLVRATNQTNLSKTEGWWNSINGGDFDGDGDTDYILGNLGFNSKYNASAEEPLCIYANDYDKDGRMDPVMCYYINGENYIAHSRDELIRQINAMRVRFKTYKSYAETPFEKSFLPEELEGAYVVRSHNFASSYLENLGNGIFTLSNLPMAAQTAPVEGILVDDINSDGFEDVVLTGNSYATEVATGRYDALKGIVLKGNGNGTFASMSLEESGFINDFDGSGLARISNGKGEQQIIVANNNGPLEVFKQLKATEPKQVLYPEKSSLKADIFYKNGRHVKKEFYFGSGYLSQSSRAIIIDDQIKEIKITDAKGTKTYTAGEIN